MREHAGVWRRYQSRHRIRTSTSIPSILVDLIAPWVFTFAGKGLHFWRYLEDDALPQPDPGHCST
jgi:hypothetical protein